MHRQKKKRSLPPSSIGLDVGCGNFRNNINEKVFMVGCDMCLNLLEQRSNKLKTEVFRGDALSLPYRTGTQVNT